MNAKTPTIAKVNRNAETILMLKLGVGYTLRFLNQFNYGACDYTSERHKWLDSLVFILR